ncbi:MAG TPA: TIGR04283 family arsenosugar biosynthesis glycosyltransferase [Bryobacteraceae bacterium]|nr:TIGR04283 family arsenosugar biosynthesis glycosyltransferase [Bryobacteraceae bacterium]
MAAGISVIIPAYQEVCTIAGLVAHLRALKAGEVIVVDGHSEDGTAGEARRAGALVLVAERGRAAQMNAGARASRGDVLLFLHADVRLGGAALAAIRDSLRDPAVQGGNLDIRYEGGDVAAACFTLVNRWRRRWGVFYGDSGIFCRRAAFEALGGFRPWPILEDYDFARRLWRFGRVALLREPIYVSARRWRNGGLARTLASWAVIQGLYFLGVPPQRLARWYRAVR